MPLAALAASIVCDATENTREKTVRPLSRGVVENPIQIVLLNGFGIDHI
jgi:hypothetical protein